VTVNQIATRVTIWKRPSRGTSSRRTLDGIAYARERMTNESNETQTLGRFLNSRQTT